MGNINMFAVVMASLAFFAVGAVWYGVLFSKPWQRETGVTEAPRGAQVAKIMGLTFAFEMLVVLMLEHTIARTGASDRAIMMIAIGFGLSIMTPAIGINYLHQRKSLTLFLIDAGHFVVGMALAGAVLLYLR
ncbi:DUF1761 domain-containing protein [Qipengyuania sp. RANM35]|uniref:DUF1761 domain-containing protein n=1 Tax=Qipengyuania sp. RANM35 TaxID=3068635 RepID=UPI0034DAC7D1